MLRHMIDRHSNEDWSLVKFNMRVLKFIQSSFKRQILESVLIQGNRHHNIMNSRSEYNRCALPRLATKMGEKEMKERKENEALLDEENDSLDRKIRAMKRKKK